MRYVSGIRPTGSIHLGNYLGAIKQWRSLPGITVFVADLHSNGDIEEALDTMAALNKLGFVPVLESYYSGSILEIQHQISRYVGTGRLERMTQYKDKCETEQATLSLLAYPVLMAADIFYFGGTHIPVGNDQVQHIEFARDLCDILAFNGIHYDKPEAVIGEYPRIMSLTDGTKKMSKSDADDFSRINIDDSPDLIRKKIASAKTAMTMTMDTPEMNNLHTIYRAVGGNQNHIRFKEFKEELAELIIAELAA